MAKPRKTEKNSQKQPTPATTLPLAELMRPGAFAEADIRAAWISGLQPLIEQYQFITQYLDYLKWQFADRDTIADAIHKEGYSSQLLLDLQSRQHEISEKLTRLTGPTRWYEPTPPKEYKEEGAEFRRKYKDMTPLEVNEYLLNRPINVWWLVGFSGDSAMMKKMQERAQRPRPGARRGRKWNKQVRDAAESAYREWIKNAQTHPVWNASWGKFAKVCIDLIKRETGVDVPEDALRRSILPVNKFPRPE